MNDRAYQRGEKEYGAKVNLAQFFDEDENVQSYFEQPTFGISKRCIDCGVIYPLNNFSSKKSNLDRKDCICKGCRKLRKDELDHVKKFAPPKPDKCDACGKKIEYDPTRLKMGLCCDHDKRTKKFRGWLCNECNLGIGMLGDTLESIEKVYNYMKERTVIE